MMNKGHDAMTEPSARIRQACAEDAGAISDCVAAAYRPYIARIGKPPTPMLENYVETIQRHTVFVLTVDDKIVGVLVLTKQDQQLLLDNVAVHPDYQRQGFGRQLMALAEAHAKTNSLETIILYTNEQMTENIELYKKLGFVETERRIEEGYRRVYMRKEIK
jgi:ribosomal protein S18 acetylase RimI-like enzyme